MTGRIEVIYENGVFRPVQSLAGQFQEQQRLTMMIEEPQASTGWLADADPTISLEAVRQALGRTSQTIAQMVNEEREER